MPNQKILGADRENLAAFRGATAFFAVIISFSTACGSGKGTSTDDEAVGGSLDGKVVDGRLIADVYTWNCYDPSTGAEYQGAFGQEISLEYAPRGIPSLDLPAVGTCEASVDMFPNDAGANALDLPGLTDDPEWASDVDDGSLAHLGTGYYRDDVYPSTRTCYSTDEVMGGGVELVAAEDLTGARTPVPEEAPNVRFEGFSGSALQFGDPATISWDAHLWKETWVQVRREREGEAWETVTCNVTGLDSFALNEAVWGLMDASLSVDQNNLYVGFQTRDSQSVAGGLVETVTRAIAVAVVQE